LVTELSYNANAPAYPNADDKSKATMHLPFFLPPLLLYFVNPITHADADVIIYPMNNEQREILAFSEFKRTNNEMMLQTTTQQEITLKHGGDMM
jgi:hypothetical protein